MNEPTPRYGHSPIAMRCVAGENEIDILGDFAWVKGDDGRHILMTIPRPSDANPDGWVMIRILVKQGQNETGKHWGWNGDSDKPTLTPSVHTIGHWHGWVRDGFLVEV